MTGISPADDILTEIDTSSEPVQNTYTGVSTSITAAIPALLRGMSRHHPYRRALVPRDLSTEPSVTDSNTASTTDTSALARLFHRNQGTAPTKQAVDTLNGKAVANTDSRLETLSTEESSKVSDISDAIRFLAHPGSINMLYTAGRAKKGKGHRELRAYITGATDNATLSSLAHLGQEHLSMNESSWKHIVSSFGDESTVILPQDFSREFHRSMQASVMIPKSGGTVIQTLGLPIPDMKAFSQYLENIRGRAVLNPYKDIPLMGVEVHVCDPIAKSQDDGLSTSPKSVDTSGDDVQGAAQKSAEQEQKSTQAGDGPWMVACGAREIDLTGSKAAVSILRKTV